MHKHSLAMAILALSVVSSSAHASSVLDALYKAIAAQQSALAPLPTVVLPKPPVVAPKPPVIPEGTIIKKFTTGCNAGNFRGIVEGEYGRDKSGSHWVHTHRYKIERVYGQSGGNKANINMGMVNSPMKSVPLNGANSSNNLKQDNTWQTLNLGLHAKTYNGTFDYGFQFVFDKFGPDPKCEVIKKMTF